MNRAQRSKMKSKDPNLVELAELLNTPAPLLEEGSHVRINVEQIMKRKDFASKSPAYKQFLSDHTDEVFTVHRVFDQHPIIVELVEDPSDLKWLWFEYDLIPVTEAGANDSKKKL